MTETPFSEQVYELAEQIRPLLAGKDTAIVSAALADLTAMWVCGHVVLGDWGATQAVRQQVFSAYIGLVKTLVESGVDEPRGG